jgi:hypothetical protein
MQNITIWGRFYASHAARVWLTTMIGGLSFSNFKCAASI